MSRAILLCFCLGMSWVPSAHAEDTPPKPTAEEQWLRALRGSTTYREGMATVRRLVEAAYDEGAIAGASHWDDIHEYYLGLAREKGCERGLPYAQAPSKACHRTAGEPPAITGRIYEERLAKVTRLANETTHPGLVRQILAVLFDYGYAQGLKHGMRSRAEDIRWKQAFYRACMLRANGPAGEDPCARAAKEWAEEQLGQLEKQIETHGLSAERSAK